MKNKTRNLLSILSVAVFFVAGVFVEAAYGVGDSIALVCIAAMIIPIVCFIINYVAGKAYRNRMSKTPIAEMNKYFVSHRDEAEKAAAAKLSYICRIRGITYVYYALLFACAAVLGFGGGVMCSNGYSISGVMYSAFLFFIIYGRVEKKSKICLSDNAPVLDREQFQTLYALADKAALTLGYNKDIQILISIDCNAGVVSDGEKCVIQLGINLLHILSDDELYEVFLHEFAHIVSKSEKVRRVERYLNMITDRDDMREPGFIMNLFLGLDSLFVINYMLYQYASSLIDELQADSAMMKHGDAEAAVSMLLKLHYSEMYEYSKGNADEPSVFASEQLERGEVKDTIEAFKSAIAAHADEWNRYAENEILANNATHPTFKMRMGALEIYDIKTVDRDSSESYKKEMLLALDICEDYLYEAVKDEYDKLRKERYIEPLDRVNSWIEGGRKISAETYADIVSDLRSLGRNTEAMEVCNRAIEELPHHSALYAYYMVGCSRLANFDRSGIEYIYTAIEENMNFFEEGMEMIGNFCCKTGYTEGLCEYRRRAVELAQKEKDEDRHAGTISSNDELVSEHLPDGMLENILEFIRSQDSGIIDKVYLVRKVISPTFFTSAFIIHFYGGTDEQRGQIMHSIFRFLDGYPVDWQFSLFDRDHCMDVKLDSIEGSLVYKKNTDETEEK